MWIRVDKSNFTSGTKSSVFKSSPGLFKTPHMVESSNNKGSFAEITPPAASEVKLGQAMGGPGM